MLQTAKNQRMQRETSLIRAFLALKANSPKLNDQARYTIGGDLELPDLNLVLCDLDGMPITSKGFIESQSFTEWRVQMGA